MWSRHRLLWSAELRSDTMSWFEVPLMSPLSSSRTSLPRKRWFSPAFLPEPPGCWRELQADRHQKGQAVLSRRGDRPRLGEGPAGRGEAEPTRPRRRSARPVPAAATGDGCPRSMRSELGRANARARLELPGGRPVRRRRGGAAQPCTGWRGPCGGRWAPGGPRRLGEGAAGPGRGPGAGGWRWGWRSG